MIKCFVLFTIFTFSVSCNSQKSHIEDTNQYNTSTNKQTAFLCATLAESNRIIFQIANDGFTTLDTLFIYTLGEERNPNENLFVRIDTNTTTCYFFDYLLDEHAEEYVYNYLVSLDLNTMIATKVYDFKNFYINFWDIDFEQGNMFFIDFERFTLFKFNLYTRSITRVFEYEKQKHLSHFQMEFNLNSIILYYKNSFNTNEIVISQSDLSKTIERQIWSTPPPQSANIFIKEDDLFCEVVGDDPIRTIYLYDKFGNTKQKRLNKNFEGSINTIWFNHHILLWDYNSLCVYNKNLDHVKTFETNKILKTVASNSELGVVFKSLSAKNECFLLDPNFSFIAIPNDPFSNLLIVSIVN